MEIKLQTNFTKILKKTRKRNAIVNYLSHHYDMEIQAWTNEGPHGLWGLCPVDSKFYVEYTRQVLKKIDFKRTSNEDVIVFGMDPPCEMEIKSGTYEDLGVYGTQAIDVQNLTYM